MLAAGDTYRGQPEERHPHATAVTDAPAYLERALEALPRPVRRGTRELQIGATDQQRGPAALVPRLLKPLPGPVQELLGALVLTAQTGDRSLVGEQIGDHLGTRDLQERRPAL